MSDYLETTTIGGRTWAAGLNWEIPNVSVEKKPAKYAKTSGASLYCLPDSIAIGDEGNRVIGLSHSNDKAHVGLPSLAAAVALRYQNALVVAKLDPGGEQTAAVPEHGADKEITSRYWLGCIGADGSILPGGDIVSTDVQTILSEIHMQLRMQAEDSDVTIVASDDLALLLKADDVPGSIETSSLEALLPEGLTGVATLNEVAQNAHRKWLALALVGLIVVAGSSLYVLNSNKGAPQVTQPKMTHAEMMAMKRARYEKDALAAVNRILPANDATQWVMSIRDSVFQMPLTSAGLSLDTVACSYDGDCDFDFITTGAMHIAAFEDRYKPVVEGEILFPLDGQSARFSRHFDLDNQPDERGVDFIKNPPKANAFFKRLLARFNVLKNSGVSGFQYSSNSNPSVIKGITPPDASYPMLYQGQIRVQIKSLWVLKTMLQLLQNPYVSINKVIIKAHDEPSIILEAKYVVSQ